MRRGIDWRIGNGEKSEMGDVNVLLFQTLNYGPESIRCH